jgi:putative ABC transport system permease protein
VFGYYLDLAWRSLRRHVVLTALMIAAIAFGVGASMTTLTVLHVLSRDPIPGKSHDLYHVQLDPRPASRTGEHAAGDEPLGQLTRADAEALLRAGRADHQAMMVGGNAGVEPVNEGGAASALPASFVDARWTSADFFAMFQVPFAAGRAWTAEDDAGAARVVVITRELAEKLFGAVAVTGRSVRVNGTPMRIVGVIDRWQLSPHFYDLTSGTYGIAEEVFAPFSTSRELRFGLSGDMNCWEDAPDPEAVGAPCDWIQFWVELDGKDRAAAYHDFLVQYSEDQRKAGRFQRPPNVRLRDVIAWLDHKQVVPDEVHLQTTVALGFLAVCLINTVGLLLTKFLRRSGEIGVRRALGASRRSIFLQLMVEAGVIGVAGGALGLGLAWLGLVAVRHQPTDYAELARLDLPMLAATVGLAIGSSLLAGLLPAWRGCQLPPAIQLKSQ